MMQFLALRLARWTRLFVAGICAMVLWGLSQGSAMAVLTDDRFDGEIYALYAGNGALVPPKTSLAQSIAKGKPVLLVFYVDDSADCKAFSSVVSNAQALYGRAATIVPIRVDSLVPKDSYEPTEPGFYYKGYVPQVVVFDQGGKVTLDESGMVPFEKIDDAFRKIFDLLPRTESPKLQRRQFNEVSGEMAQ
jgi:hypothetical protein